MSVHSEADKDQNVILNQNDFASKLSNTLMELSNISNDMKIDINNLTSLSEHTLSPLMAGTLATPAQPIDQQMDDVNSLSMNCAHMSMSVWNQINQDNKGNDS